NCCDTEMKKQKNGDLDEVLRQERGRGKKYVPSEEEKQAHRLLKKQWKDILAVMGWEDVVTALSLQEGTPEYDEYRRIWQSYRRDSGAF
ncbi:MAG TPA: hypothetical protein VF443_09265, partial [Nitrospira sp.]